MMNCLGPLSRIYKHAINESFYLAKNLASLVLKVMSSKRHYESLCGDGNSEGIALAQLADSMQGCFRGFEGLDKEEVSHLALYCFASVLCYGRSKRRLLPKKTMNAQAHDQLRHLLHGHTEFWGNKANILDMYNDTNLCLERDDFLAAAHFEDKISVDTAVALFDQTRAVGPLEYLFSPKFFRNFQAISIGKAHHPSGITPGESNALAVETHELPDATRCDLGSSAMRNQVDDQNEARAGREKERKKNDELSLQIQMHMAAVEEHVDQRLQQLKEQMESKLEALQLMQASPPTGSSGADLHRAASTSTWGQELPDNTKSLHSVLTQISKQEQQLQLAEQRNAEMTLRISKMTESFSQLSRKTEELQTAQDIHVSHVALQVDLLTKAVQSLAGGANQQDSCLQPAALTGVPPMEQAQEMHPDGILTTGCLSLEDRFKKGDLPTGSLGVQKHLERNRHP